MFWFRTDELPKSGPGGDREEIEGLRMITIAVKNASGQETGQTYSFEPSELIRLAENQSYEQAVEAHKQLLHDAVVMYQANERQGTMKTKSRAEVGNARMGTKRSPIRRGGGHCFQKLPRDFSYRMPRKALQAATRYALLSKFKDHQVVVLDELALTAPKTKVIAGLLKALGVEGQSCILATDQHDAVVWQSSRNIPQLAVSPAAELNAYKLLAPKHLIVTKAALDKVRALAKPAAAAAQ
jgi:large subunit ribosomal protein L4